VEVAEVLNWKEGKDLTAETQRTQREI